MNATECRWCKFWFKPNHLEYEKFGHCRRFPHEIAKYPTDWCGEFKEKENRDAA